MRTGGERVWRSWLNDRLAGLADLLLNTEPLWVMPAMGFTFATLLWGLSHSWVGLVIASLPFLLRRWRKGYLTNRTPFEIPVALFLLASLIGLAVSPDRDLSLRVFQSCIGCTLLFYSLVNIPHPAYIKWGFALTGAGVVTAMLLALAPDLNPPPVTGAFGSWVQEQLGRLPHVPSLSNVVTPTLTAAHGLTIGVQIVLVPLIGLVLFTPKLTAKTAALLLSLPLLILLFLFGSQAAWLAVLVGLIVLLVWRSRWAVLPIAAVLGLVYLAYAQGWIDPHAFFSRFSPWASLKGRVELWQAAAAVIREHPVAGCGLGCLGKYATTHLSPHNAYLQFYADMGLVGALALLGALAAGAKMALGLLKAPRDHPWYGFTAGLLAAAVAVGVHGLFEASPAGFLAQTGDGYFYVVSPILWILAGLFVRTHYMVSTVPEEPPE